MPMLKFHEQKTRKSHLNCEPFRRAMGSLYPLQSNAFSWRSGQPSPDWVRPFTDTSSMFPHTGHSMQRISDMIREQLAYADALKHDLARGPAPRPRDLTQARLKAANAEVNDGFLLLKAAEEQIPLQGSAPGPFNKTHIALLPSRAVYYADTTGRPLCHETLTSILRIVQLRIQFSVTPSRNATADYSWPDVGSVGAFAAARRFCAQRGL